MRSRRLPGCVFPARHQFAARATAHNRHPLPRAACRPGGRYLRLAAEATRPTSSGGIWRKPCRVRIAADRAASCRSVGRRWASSDHRRERPRAPLAAGRLCAAPHHQNRAERGENPRSGRPQRIIGRSAWERLCAAAQTARDELRESRHRRESAASAREFDCLQLRG